MELLTYILCYGKLELGRCFDYLINITFSASKSILNYLFVYNSISLEIISLFLDQKKFYFLSIIAARSSLPSYMSVLYNRSHTLSLSTSFLNQNTVYIIMELE